MSKKMDSGNKAKRIDGEHFVSDSGEFFVTSEAKDDYHRFGYVIVRGLLSKEELSKLKGSLERSQDIRKYAYGREDSGGRMSKMCLWNYAGNDVCGILARSQKVAGTMQSLMGGDEIYHYGSKLMMKEAKTGGAFVWHQDYGYWYQNGCLYPEMATAFIPVDRCTRDNGCLQVLSGSHKMGRIDHRLTGDQAGADLQRLEDVKQVCPLVFVELEPGDALFFHCNLLHSSTRNDSDERRWAFLVAYNKRMNSPLREHHHPLYHPLRIIQNSAILQCNLVDSTEEKWFANPDKDNSAQSLEKNA